jgi:hypothetical protein
MYLSFITGNILQKFCKDNYNVVYYPQNNLFDTMLMSIRQHNYYLFGENQKDYNMSNVIDLPPSYIKLYNYNLCCTNNIIGFTSNNLKQFHLNTLIFTHSYKPPYIKKEDALLMSQRLERETKIFFSENAKQSWNLMGGSLVIKYGIPTDFKIIKSSSDRKDILIINTENLPHNQQLYQAIISKGYSCDIVNSITNNSKTINNKFNEYKICIDLAEHNIANLLCAISSGCVGVSIKTPMLMNDYNIPGLILVDSINTLLDSINDLLTIPDTEKEAFSAEANSVFNFNTFSKNIDGLMLKANMEAFIL